MKSKKGITSCDLYNFAEETSVAVCSASIPLNKSLSVQMQDGTCYIGMDLYFESEADEKVHLAHELGHCETGSFYNLYSKWDVRQKHERQANNWAIKKLVPEDEFWDAVKDGCCEPWQIAEKFDLPNKFAYDVMSFYLNR